MKETKGRPLPLGASVEENRVNFAVEAEEKARCQVLLYKKGEPLPFKEIPMKGRIGKVHFTGVSGMDPADWEYNFLIDGVLSQDPRARKLIGREIWNDPTEKGPHEVRCGFLSAKYDWEGDEPVLLPYQKAIGYSLHVRGFTMHPSSRVTGKGTFQGVREKLSYLKELGVNQLHLLPVYEFQEKKHPLNYWGYGEGFYFAPKSAYAASGDGEKELKDLVKTMHQEGIEIVLELPFAQGTSPQLMEECVRFYRMEYHIDGFVLDEWNAPVSAIRKDPVLAGTKIMTRQPEFSKVMRRFLKGDEGMVEGVMYWLRRYTAKEEQYHEITSHTGFTLHDLVSYDRKHNEENRENNRDGTDYNYSWNCGEEGETRKRTIQNLRKNQIRNAFFLLLTGQGAPCILSGDEFSNSQKGNNNPYCQDNAITWLDWRELKKEKQLFEFVKGLIRIRKEYQIFGQPEELTGNDRKGVGIPDISYHGEHAWRVPSEISSRQLGILYSGQTVNDRSVFIAYNMHWEEHDFALPVLQRKKRWYKLAGTREGILEAFEELEDQRMIRIKERSIVLLAEGERKEKQKGYESLATFQDDQPS